MENKAITATSKYPDKPITLIVPFSVGSSLDLVARALEKTAIKQLGQPLIIINKPGGAGTVAWNEVAGAAPDGYTIGMTSTEMVLHPLYDSTKYNYPTALEPLAQVSDISMVMVVQSDQPWRSVDDLIKYASQHPGQLKFANSSLGSLSHITGETFAKAANIDLMQVPFQGGAESMANLLGGHVQIAFLSPALVKENIKNGKVRALAVAGNQRLTDPLFANIPTFKEQGVDVAFSDWHILAAPKEIPLEVKNKLTDGFNRIINDPEFKSNMNNLGLEVNYLDAKDSQEKWINENQKLSRTVQDTGILDLIKAQRK
ncbi:tripartite tricarboxylate transporter substrate binding protein [Pelosinus baikalensis]|uniref:Tripartite tricarboxylate transporter substrate binding protein n=1 Tax=Pelosinus baikalensis TaxID=2892015 RepID=A0ABS8HRR8_9FIRM|nr:tripartite tricarboxylate transporter substrate binding protein [Pelosinus baikalensis]MCC5465888.1 tripartite tricarboxylate transporter substrate binding protein [Pelosinus baikalensis]